MQLSRLIYTSRHDNSRVETLDTILGTSRRNNARDHVSGALVISDRHFLQVLEGERSVIAACFLRIIQDPRHREIQVISAGDQKQRLFHEWTMHRIDAARIKQGILARYSSGGTFDPVRLSEQAIADLCRTLSMGDWEALAA